MPTAITHDPIVTFPASSTNTALVRWSGTGGNTLLDTSGILSDGSNITLNARGEVRFSDADSSHYIAFESPATVSTSYTMTLPADLPAANEVLTVTSYSSGAGVLEWAAAGGDLSFGGDTFGANKVIGSNDAYSLSLETAGTTRMTIASGGAITKPTQPSFIAKLTTAQNNVLGGSGGGALLDLRVANSNWSIIEERVECFNNGTFTAPVTGLYLVHCFISLGGLASTNTYSNLWLDTDTPHGNLQITSEHAWNGAYTPSGERPIRWSALMEFDANDTAYISGHIYYGNTVIDVQVNTYFSAMLVA